MRKKMRTIYLILFCLTFSGCTGPEKKSEVHDHETMVENKENGKTKSPKRMAMTNVGRNHVHIEYSAPQKRGRQIFGGLVAFGEVWVTGAHRATTIQFSQDVIIENTKIAAGKYALFTIPGEEEWTIIINKNWDQHLADDYDPNEDLVRVRTVPTILEQPLESLTYDVEALDETTGKIIISWDDISVDFKIKNTES